MPAEAMRARLRGELAAAMTSRKLQKAKVLRALIAAIDNAEAIKVEQVGPYRERAFGDPSGEVPRKVLGAEEVRNLIEADAEEREHSAQIIRMTGQTDRALELEQEARLVRNFLS